MLSSDWIARRVAPRLLYFPAALEEDRSSPERHGVAGEEATIRTEDGVLLHAWWIPGREDPRLSGRRASLLYLHGNAGHLAGRAYLADRLSRRGLDVLLLDYRGYGRSSGRPSEPGLRLDARAAYRHLTEERDRDPARLVVAGHSLGGAVAARVAAESSSGDSPGPAGLAVTSCFRSVPEAGRRLYPWLPQAFFRDWPTNRFAAGEWLRRVSCPVLVGCGGRDDVMPRAETRALFEAAPEPRRWVEVPEAGHGDLWLADAFLDELAGFVAEVTGTGEGP